MKRIYLPILALFIVFTTFSQSPVTVDRVYVKTLENWQQSISRWKLRNFVPLIGLDLLKEGENTFGRDISNDIVVNSPDAPLFMGKIVKNGKDLNYVNSHEIKVTLEGKKVETIDYTFDSDRNSERLRFNFIKWYIQYVEDDFFLRFLDDTSPLVSTFEPFDYYPANQEMIIQGKYKEYKKVKVIPLNNVISLTQRHEHSGSVTFKYGGEKYELEVIEGRIIMFTDETNVDSTFPYGRYLRVTSDKAGNMILDFNYSFAPPRSVSLYTTCDLPPAQNQLNFRVEAGEKYENTGEEIIRVIK